MKYNNLDPGTIEAVVNKLGGVDGVRRFLSGQIVVQAVATIHEFLVDYTMSLSDMIKVGQYNWVNSDVSEKNFPRNSATNGQVTTKAELLHFGRDISSDDALAEMGKLRFRPATLEELLAFGAKYPEVQREFPIVALGSVCSLHGVRRVPILDRGVSERGLRLYWFVNAWYGYYRFLVVHN